MFGLNFNLTTILAIALAAALAGCWFLWRLDRHDDHRADVAEAALKVEAANEKIVTRYVREVVNVPGPTVVRERLVAGVCHTLDLSRVPGADGAAGANPAAGLPDAPGEFSRQLSAELAAVRRNQAKLDALQAELKPQT